MTFSPQLLVLVVFGYFLGACNADLFPALFPNTSVACGSEFRSLVYYNKSTLASMLAASGKNIFDYGDFDACSRIDKAHFCKVTLELNAIPIPVGVGVCMPDNCGSSDAVEVANWVLSEYNLTLNSDYKATANCGAWNVQISAGAIGVMCLLSAFVLLALLGSATEMWTEHLKKKQQERALKQHQQTGAEDDVKVQLETNTDDLREGLLTAEPRRKKRDLYGCFSAFLLHFSLIRNYRSLVERRPPSHTDALNGIRVMSFGWVVLGHTLAFNFEGNGFDNPQVLAPPNGVLSSWTFQIIPGGFFAVDTFFWLAGFLMTYTMLRYLRRDPNALTLAKVPFLYLMRFLRLTPIYMILVAVGWKLFPIISSGPFWSERFPDADCDQYWWTNLLYINNLVPWASGGMCMGWTWYMSNDFQFFLVAPFLILIYYRCAARKPAFLLPYLPGYGTVVLLLIGSTLANWLVADHYKLAISPFSTTSGGFGMYYLLYIKPYCRIQPYLVGILLAFAYDTQLYGWDRRYRDSKLPWWGVVTCFLTAFAIIGLCVFTPVSFYSSATGWSQLQNNLYLSFSRTGWGVALSLLTYCFLLEQGGWLQAFLSAGFWEPIAKLTFCGYLLHAYCIYYVFDSMQRPSHFQVTTFAYFYVSFVVLALALSFLFFLFVEQPLANLTGLLSGKSKKKNPPAQKQ